MVHKGLGLPGDPSKLEQLAKEYMYVLYTMMLLYHIRWTSHQKQGPYCMLEISIFSINCDLNVNYVKCVRTIRRSGADESTVYNLHHGKHFVGSARLLMPVTSYPMGNGYIVIYIIIANLNDAMRISGPEI